MIFSEYGKFNLTSCQIKPFSYFFKLNRSVNCVFFKVVFWSINGSATNYDGGEGGGLSQFTFSMKRGEGGRQFRFLADKGGKGGGVRTPPFLADIIWQKSAKMGNILNTCHILEFSSTRCVQNGPCKEVSLLFQVTLVSCSPKKYSYQLSPAGWPARKHSRLGLFQEYQNMRWLCGSFKQYQH